MSKFNFVLLSMLGMMFLLILLYATAIYLPTPVQRAISFLPNIQVDRIARDTAMETLEWRLNLWREGVNELKNNPGYWVIGKGYTFSNEEIEMLRLGRPGEYNYWWAVINTTYHNGPLSLLIGLGLSGLVLGSLILVAFSWRHYRFVNQPWASPWLQRFFLILFLYNSASIAVFFLIYGDAFNNYPVILYRIGMLEALYFADRQIKGRKIQSADSPPESSPDPSARGVHQGDPRPARYLT